MRFWVVRTAPPLSVAARRNVHFHQRFPSKMKGCRVNDPQVVVDLSKESLCHGANIRLEVTLLAKLLQHALVFSWHLLRLGREDHQGPAKDQSRRSSKDSWTYVFHRTLRYLG